MTTYAIVIDTVEALFDVAETKAHDPKSKINQVTKCDGFVAFNLPDDGEYYAFLFKSECLRDEAFKLASVLFTSAIKIEAPIEIDEPMMN